jgi:hypothetical protein
LQAESRVAFSLRITVTIILQFHNSLFCLSLLLLLLLKVSCIYRNSPDMLNIEANSLDVLASRRHILGYIVASID